MSTEFDQPPAPTTPAEYPAATPSAPQASPEASQPATPTPATTMPAPNVPVRTTPPMPEQLKKILPFLIALLAIVSGIVIFLIIQRFNPPQPPPSPVTIVVTPTLTPTPIRQKTKVADTAEYLQFQQDIASFSAEVKAFERDDPMLAPPNLSLPLGFSK